MQIELHLGVHKTATTHLQRHWVACSAALPRDAVVCPELTDVRKYLTPCCGVTTSTPPPGAPPTREQVARTWLAHLAKQTEHLVLSDENLLGGCEGLFSQRAIYAGASTRLQRLAAVLQEHPVRVWLCVREYGAFLRSAYCETLRHGPYRPFRQMYSGIEPKQRGWEHLARDVLEAFPQAELMCWRYEDLERVRGVVTSSLFGVPMAQLPAPDRQRDRRSLSRMAVRLLDDVFERVGADEATRVRPSVERVVTGHSMPSFDPWEPTESAHFSTTYGLSLVALKGLRRVSWVSAAGA